MLPDPRVPNFMTVDFEEWFHVNYPGIDTRSFASQPSDIAAQTDRLLSVFHNTGARCTFFVLGATALKYPDVIRKIHAAGHEIASHGYGHRSVREMDRSAFRADLVRASDILESLIDTPVRGFRAPSFSLTADILPWYYGTLEELGFAYSSSVFSGKTFLYGIPNFPYYIHTPSGEGWKTAVVEFPITRIRLGRTVLPLYLRMFPAWFLSAHIRRENAALRSATLYVHPREVDPHQPRLPLTRLTRFIHYYGISGCERKLMDLLSRGRFTTMRDYVDQRFNVGTSPRAGN